MNHDFLIGSAQLNQAFESQEAGGCGARGNGITRRSFIKRTGAATVATFIAWNSLSNSARAADTLPASVDCYKREYQWKIFVSSHPKDSEGNFKMEGYETALVYSSGHTKLGELKLHCLATLYPKLEDTVTPQQMATGIPEDKLKDEVDFAQKGNLKYDGDKLDFLTSADDAILPGMNSTGEQQDFSSTVTVNEKLEYYSKSTTPWKSGDPEPSPPDAPEFKDNPDAESAKSAVPGVTHMAMGIQWSEFGWTWTGALHADANFTLSNANIGSWNPGTQEAKNNPISLIWGLGKASRNRLLKRAANDPDYKAVADGDNAEGWSKWLP